jgi:hypothetical protein
MSPTPELACLRRPGIVNGPPEAARFLSDTIRRCSWVAQAGDC